MTRFTFTTSIERDDDEIDVRVVYDVTPFVAATYWQPAEGGEVEVISIKFIGVDAASMPSPITDAEETKIHAECESRCASDLDDAQADADDWAYQEFRDRQLMRALERGE